MTVALIDNGSLEPAAHLNLRTVAAALSKKAGVKVTAISWKHSDRVPAATLGGDAAWALTPWVRAQVARGEREFVFVPFFISAQGAIGSALRSDLEKLQRETAASGGFRFTFTEGLAERDAVAAIVAQRVRETRSSANLRRPAVMVVDHGGPSAASAALRDSLAAEARRLLGAEIGPLAAASMEGAHPPLLADQLATHGFDRGDVVVAPLFLSPGRHAGAEGDIVQICRAAEMRFPTLRCHLTGLVGTHPSAVEPLALALRETLATFHLPSLA
jgi:sirohydrochlorin ferrochelatase